MQILKPFTISININKDNFSFLVTQLTINKSFETFQIKHQAREILLKSNRPLWRNRGVMKRRPDFTIEEGEINSKYAMEMIVQAIMKEVEPLNRFWKR